MAMAARLPGSWELSLNCSSVGVLAPRKARTGPPRGANARLGVLLWIATRGSSRPRGPARLDERRRREKLFGGHLDKKNRERRGHGGASRSHACMQSRVRSKGSPSSENFQAWSSESVRWSPGTKLRFSSIEEKDRRGETRGR
ncbi:hypothetical protein PR202_gb15753 [Eleusine coracana subsp. coracana]|uniref:Uncharacterized protein n=1 Tax=Eleusine coracana subsp. coracana TaxID=191504 RepID=A0AAV5EYQ2_ELECO|nr:hypothetical protein PR202_gb15753 [Eleusine coracana subsp. coracana]